MPRSRKSQIALKATPYYHCTSRCVGRAFLCGCFEHSDNDYEHRRGWIEQRMIQLVEVYSLDICAYAVMSNHYHIVLHINAEKAQAWTDWQVIERWHRLYSGNFLTQQYMAGKYLYEEQLKAITELAAEWRERLNIDAEHWIYNTQHFESQFKSLVGTVISIKAKFQQFGYQQTPGLRLAELLTKIRSSVYRKHSS